jgi:hypothetical protein
VKLNDTGADVGAAQQALVECGYGIDGAELQARRFGAATLAALRAFQAAHIGPDGHALVEDGIVGPATTWALSHPNGAGLSYFAKDWRSDGLIARAELVPVLRWAALQVGTHETPDGSNRGAEIDQWTGLVGAGAGVVGPPWCAYFASAAYAQLAGGSPFGRLASALKMREWGVSKGRALAPSSADAGDVFVILRDNHGHVGIVCARLSDERVATLEGNASNSVKGLTRDVSQFTCVVRPLAS